MGKYLLGGWWGERYCKKNKLVKVEVWKCRLCLGSSELIRVFEV